MPHDSALVRHGSKSEYKGRHLFGQEDHVAHYASDISKVLSNERIDLIIPIASGGFEPSALTADYLGVDKMFPLRYSRVSRTDSKVLVPSRAPVRYPKQQIKGKRILIIDDIVGSGRTLSQFAKWIRRHSPTKVYFAVVQGGQTDLKSHNLHKHDNSQHLYTCDEEHALAG